MSIIFSWFSISDQESNAGVFEKASSSAMNETSKAMNSSSITGKSIKEQHKKKSMAAFWVDNTSTGVKSKRGKLTKGCITVKSINAKNAKSKSIRGER